MRLKLLAFLQELIFLVLSCQFDPKLLVMIHCLDRVLSLVPNFWLEFENDVQLGPVLLFAI